MEKTKKQNNAFLIYTDGDDGEAMAARVMEAEQRLFQMYKAAKKAGRPAKLPVDEWLTQFTPVEHNGLTILGSFELTEDGAFVPLVDLQEDGRCLPVLKDPREDDDMHRPPPDPLEISTALDQDREARNPCFSEMSVP